MNKDASKFRTVGGFVAGVLIGSAMVAPVFAAATEVLPTWRTLFMLGAILLLVIGLMLEAVVASGSPRRKVPRAGRPQPGAPFGEVIDTERSQA